MSLDPVKTLVRELLSDADVANVAGSNVFGGLIPPESDPPLILVRLLSSRPATRPATQWWAFALSVDVHHDDPAQSWALAQHVERVVNAIEGRSVAEGVYQACEVTRITSIADGGFTPSRYRNVVTVEATARNN